MEYHVEFHVEFHINPNEIGEFNNIYYYDLNDELEVEESENGEDRKDSPFLDRVLQPTK